MKEYKNIMELYYKSLDKKDYHKLYEKYIDPEFDKIMKSKSFSDVDECAGSLAANAEMLGFVMGFKYSTDLWKEC